MTSEIECFHKYWNSASGTPRYPLKTDFMFYISLRVRFSPNSGKICTNSFYVMNMLSTFVLFYLFSNHYMGVCGTRGLTNRKFSLIALGQFQGKIAQTWDSDEKACAIVLLLCNSLRVCASV